MTEKNNRSHQFIIPGFCFLFSGVTLIAHVYFGIWMLKVLALCFLIAGGVFYYFYKNALSEKRKIIVYLIKWGAVAGLSATFSYDIFRLILVKLGHFAFWPFEIFNLFGQALTGAAAISPLVTLVGFLYHILNGVCFAVAYTLWFGKYGIVGGIVWALLLEILMVSIYPGWLGLKPMDEFLQVSFLGHLVYGSVLGFMAQRFVKSYESK